MAQEPPPDEAPGVRLVTTSSDRISARRDSTAPETPGGAAPAAPLHPAVPLQPYRSARGRPSCAAPTILHHLLWVDGYATPDRGASRACLILSADVGFNGTASAVQHSR